MGAGFHGARDDNALREIERALSLLAGREQRWHMYERLAAGAGLELEPPALWTLARLAERPAVSEAELVEELQVEARPLGEALEELRRRSLVDAGADGTVALTERGRAGYERLVEVRCARLNTLLAGWKPDQEAELQGLVDRLGRDLVARSRSRLPWPQASGSTHAETSCGRPRGRRGRRAAACGPGVGATRARGRRGWNASGRCSPPGSDAARSAPAPAGAAARPRAARRTWAA